MRSVDSYLRENICAYVYKDAVLLSFDYLQGHVKPDSAPPSEQAGSCLLTQKRTTAPYTSLHKIEPNGHLIYQGESLT